MMTPVAEGVWVHQSEFIRTNTVVVRGQAGVLVVDPGIDDDELTCLVDDLARMDQPVVAGFSTHPDWDHLLWHAGLGEAPRYGTTGCAAAARDLLANPDVKAEITDHLSETEVAGRVALELFGLITGLPAGSARIPWDGPEVRIIEHVAHAPGHAALLIEEQGVLVAGDMLSDVLVPMLDPSAADPIEDYLAALRLLEDAADSIEIVVPGHGSIGGAGQMHARIERDRAYVHALRDGRVPDDPRIGPSAEDGWEWVSDVHAGQVQRLAGGTERTQS